ncbi:hypothetical protein [Limimaricola sp. AA108-03]|uniref:hypothetical protein n=1 Tax=Limimaricola sp. AA108-03 TaxID=3425945 RepID=UPI003D76B8D3
MPRHFDETAQKAGVPREARRRAFGDLAAAAPEALRSAPEQLPETFPAEIAEQILAYATDRLRLLKGYADSLE